MKSQNKKMIIKHNKMLVIYGFSFDTTEKLIRT